MPRTPSKASKPWVSIRSCWAIRTRSFSSTAGAWTFASARLPVGAPPQGRSGRRARRGRYLRAAGRCPRITADPAPATAGRISSHPHRATTTTMGVRLVYARWPARPVPVESGTPESPRGRECARRGVTLAAFVALGGSSYAAVKITGKQVRNNSLTGADIRTNLLTSADVRNGSLVAKDFNDSAGFVQGPESGEVWSFRRNSLRASTSTTCRPSPASVSSASPADTPSAHADPVLPEHERRRPRLRGDHHDGHRPAAGTGLPHARRRDGPRHGGRRQPDRVADRPPGNPGPVPLEAVTATHLSGNNQCRVSVVAFSQDPVDSQ